MEIHRTRKFVSGREEGLAMQWEQTALQKCRGVEQHRMGVTNLMMELGWLTKEEAEMVFGTSSCRALNALLRSLGWK